MILNYTNNSKSWDHNYTFCNFLIRIWSTRPKSQTKLDQKHKSVGIKIVFQTRPMDSRVFKPKLSIFVRKEYKTSKPKLPSEHKLKFLNVDVLWNVFQILSIRILKRVDVLFILLIRSSSPTTSEAHIGVWHGLNRTLYKIR